MSSRYDLTGGTNDVNPQPLRCRVTPTAIVAAGTTLTGSTNTVALPIPVQRLGSGGRAQVLEILSVDYDCTFATSASIINYINYYITVSTRSNGTLVPTLGSADPYSLCHVSKTLTTPGGSAVVPTVVDSGRRDLTDGAGHGLLMGMDTIYIQFGAAVQMQAASNVTPSLNVLISYRWKNVGFSEYVGMVTSS